MFHATTASTPASAASGMKLASGAASRMNNSKNTECSMPATGPCAPARTLVAVRAMVPVTQIPPKRPETTLAAPCATSSQLLRWRRPVIPSATTADSSDSIAPSSANDTADGSTSRTLPHPTSGSDGNGKLLGMPPNCVPIVATSSPAATVTAAAAATAINMPGHCGFHRLRPTMIAIVASESAIVAPSNDGR